MSVQIDFTGPVHPEPIQALLDYVAEQISLGESEFTIAISSPGGSVYAGLTAYNFLAGCGATITTHNTGHVHSIASVIFCAGSTRRCVPSGRFLIHDIHWTVNGTFHEPQLREFIEGLKGDRYSTAQVLAKTMDIEVQQVVESMQRGETFHASDAVDKGLATEIAQAVFDHKLQIMRFHGA